LRTTTLEEIIAVRRKRIELERARLPLEQVRQSAESCLADRSAGRDFTAALTRRPEISDRPNSRVQSLRIIAELKQASPSAGLIRTDFRLAEIARDYEAAGAAALSVLTEPDFFLGSIDHLEQARAAARLPVLRKDFIVDEYQVYESVAASADAILLIVAALSENELHRLSRLASQLRLSVLVEVHTEDELKRAVDIGSAIIGVNNRDLRTMQVDLENSLRLREQIPAGTIAVSESGIRSASDLKDLAEADFDAALIGEHLMRSADPGEALASMLGKSRVNS
jgi:indole-3-glycerol phosphate synthase